MEPSVELTMCLPPSAALMGPHSSGNFQGTRPWQGKQPHKALTWYLGTHYSTGVSSVYTLSLRRFHSSGTGI